MNLLPVGKTVSFGTRQGEIRGYTTLKGKSHAENYEVFYVVELNPESASYLESNGYGEHDCFIRFVLVNVGNLNEDGEDVQDAR